MVCGTESLTYADLAAQARALAAELRRRGVARGDLVGVRVTRSIDVPVAIMGTLLSGAAYVPLDPAYPAERLDFMTAEAGIRHVVGQDLPARGHPPAPDVDLPELARDDRAYVIYTSGSTGRPKGCLITHGNVLSLLEAALPLFDVGPDDRWTQFHSINFDVSVWEMWGPLVTGGTLVIVDPDAAYDPEALLDLLLTRQVTVFLQVPAVFRLLFEAHVEAGRPPHALRYVIFAGEAVDLATAAAFSAGEVRLINMYGPTETTVYATFKHLDDEALRGTTNRSPIGRALPHLSISLRDGDGVPVPDGDVGEMWIAGAGVSGGYLGRPELTAERFVTREGVRHYRTGDLARRLADGELEFLGRIDRQVKLRGFRIELAEIETVLRGCALVRDAVVEVARGSELGDYLVAYVVPADDFAPGPVRAECERRLPPHMLPATYVVVPAIPLTPSGKVDRAALAVS
ncbi:nonribosomal peptide synthetase DhbF [Asanoa ishikariensis]|uniref:Nonribosomal peptide synthetase DhbF n=1 Tax=Asanoa ishikariensis TaxID=137265 RepID=A0A1H3TBA1_9ACTN|nr:nonribosomal peptide synthetase DhbF [Asanoa ishikariensis]